MNWLMLSMAYERLGLHEQAVDYLHKAEKAMDQPDRRPDDMDPIRKRIHPLDWLTAQLWRREAEALIMKSSF